MGGPNDFDIAIGRNWERYDVGSSIYSETAWK